MKFVCSICQKTVTEKNVLKEKVGWSEVFYCSNNCKKKNLEARKKQHSRVKKWLNLLWIFTVVYVLFFVFVLLGFIPYG